MIRVEASDKDPLSPQTSTVIIYINVIDENDNEPVFSPASYSPRLSEDAEIGSVVVTVFASDDDAGRFLVIFVDNIEDQLLHYVVKYYL